MQPSYLTLEEAADMAQVSRTTLWRRIKASDVPTYPSKGDRRVRLVHRDDLAHLSTRPAPDLHTPIIEEDRDTQRRR